MGNNLNCPLTGEKLPMGQIENVAYLASQRTQEIPKHQDKEWLFKKYWEEELSLREIGKICGKSHQTIWKQFRKFKIPSRIIGGRKGEKHPFYGKHFTRKHREKISKALKGIRPSKEAREKMRKAKLGSRHPRYKGYYTDDRGNKRILMPEHPFSNSDGYILGNRLKAEEKLGRYLKPWERTHQLGKELLVFQSSSDCMKFSYALRRNTKSRTETEMETRR